MKKVIQNVCDDFRGVMDTDDFKEYVLPLLFYHLFSDNYEQNAKHELACDYPEPQNSKTPLEVWYQNNPEYIEEFEQEMRNKYHYVIKPQYLFSSTVNVARKQTSSLCEHLKEALKHIDTFSLGERFCDLFSILDLDSSKLGSNKESRESTLSKLIVTLYDGLSSSSFGKERDLLGDAYEYLLAEFSAGTRGGEFYTPQAVSTILSKIVTLDPIDPSNGYRTRLNNVLDFTFGSGSLLLNVYKEVKKSGGDIHTVYGQELNPASYNLARMNMLLYGLNPANFNIYNGDTLVNDWTLFKENDGTLFSDINTDKIEIEAVVANPPFSLKWEPKESHSYDPRFANYGVAPKSAADFAFLLHGLHFLKQDGVMAIILPHGVLFRGGAEQRIRTRLLTKNNIDAVIDLPLNLFYSTSIPVCILVLKKCKKYDDILFINASQHFEKDKNQNKLSGEHVEKIVNTYRYCTEEERYSRRVSMQEIEKNDYNLNISRYVSTVEKEPEIDLQALNSHLVDLEKQIEAELENHNEFLRELGIPPIY